MNDAVVDEFDRVGKSVDVYGEVWESRKISTYKGGGDAYVFLPKNLDDFCKICLELRKKQIDFFVLGSGSNVIVKDGFCKSAIVSTRALNKVEMRGENVYCECGARLKKVVNFGRENGLGGLEFLSGVPCTIGGAVRMNASAFMSQTADYVDKVYVLNVDCDNTSYWRSDECMCIVDKSDIAFGYRKGCDKIVVGVELAMKKMSKMQSLQRARDCLEKRVQNQPKLPSCGSVFKNGKIASAKLIEKCGLKGLKEGGAQISPQHANFIVNVGGGSASDYLALVKIAQDEVLKKFGVQLEREVVIV